MAARTAFSTTAVHLVAGDRVFVDGAGIWEVTRVSREHWNCVDWVRVEYRQLRRLANGDEYYSSALNHHKPRQRFDLALTG